MKPGTLLTLAACAVALGGCGLKGPLYLPERTGDVVIRPAPASTTPATQPATEPPVPAETQPPPPPPAPEPEVPPPGDDRG